MQEPRLEVPLLGDAAIPTRGFQGLHGELRDSVEKQHLLLNGLARNGTSTYIQLAGTSHVTLDYYKGRWELQPSVCPGRGVENQIC